MSNDYYVNVYDGYGNVTSRVKYNQKLDVWNGSNWTSGSTGRHLGITRLKNTKEFVLIRGTQWQGERDSAEIISDEEALQRILQCGDNSLLEKYFPDHNPNAEEE